MNNVEVWAVSGTEPSYPVIVAMDNKVLIGAPIFENLEHFYETLEPFESQLESLDIFIREIITAISPTPDPKVAIYEPDMLTDTEEWMQASNDWTFLVYQIWAAELALTAWKDDGYISEGSLIDDLNELFNEDGTRAYDVVILDQCMQADTPIFTEEMIQNLLEFSNADGGIIVSGTLFCDWASIVRIWHGEPDLPYWYQGPTNDELLSALFPGISLDRTETVILENGTYLNVPLFIESGDVIEINTQTGEYIRRVQ